MIKKVFFRAVITLFVTNFQLHAQQELLVLTFDDSEPMPFVKVYPNTGNPFYTDIDGKGTIEKGVNSIKLSFSGYIDTVINITSDEDIVAYMQMIPTSFDEVVILPGVNPALRIINKVIENRKINHPLANDAFTYKSYSKFIFDLDSSFNERIQHTTISDSDTSEDAGIVKMLQAQHIFMMESATERKFIPPSSDREDIIAYKVSGVNNPVFATFAQSMQSFHFYENQFELMNKKYFSPIALGSTKRYFYLIEDTTVIGNDTTFLISFRPQPDVTVETLKGLMYINTNGYAIEKVIASPSGGSDLDFEIKIIQDYKLIDGKKWFPVDLKTKIEAKSISFAFGEMQGHLVGNGTTYIKDIQLNPDDLKKRNFGNIALSTEKDAGDKSESDWDTYRNGKLSERESTTYKVIDSLAEGANIDRKLNALMALATGKLRMGPVALPLDRIIGFNFYEGFRLGAGLETSDRLMKNVVVGGYFAWGTRDKDWKYGGYSTVHLNKRLGMSINLRYQQDVVNRGNNDMVRTDWDISSASIFNSLYKKFMDRQRLAEFRFTVAPAGNLTFHLIANYQRDEFTKGYRFTDNQSTVHSKMDIAETAFEMKWNIRQKTIILGDIRRPQPTVFPKIQLKIAKGIKGIGEAVTDYTRLHLALDEDLESMRLGTLNVHLEASQTFGDVPLLFKQLGTGTRQDYNIVTINAMETAYPGEFFHDRQALFITRYTFPAIRSKVNWLSPSFTIHHGIGYGDMKDKAAHNVPFKTMDKGLYEAGLIVGLFNVNIVKLGIAAFYRYGYYSDTNALKNIVPKFSVSISGF